MKRLIIILGMRSGSSVTARLSQCMGAYLGESSELLGASLGNPDGHFENKEIVRINNEILHACGREWYSLQAPILNYQSPRIIKSMKEIKITIQKLFEKSDMVVIKDPRIALLLNLWNIVFKELEVKVDYIWVYRNPLEVMESLRKRDGYSSEHSLLLWIHYNLSILKNLHGKEYLLINYRDILEQPETLEKLGLFLGCKMNTDLAWELDHIIKRRYCHSTYSYQDVINTQNKLLIDLYDLLLQNQETKVNLPEWEERYRTEISKTENIFMDYEALENISCLKGKEIIIYGAGKRGNQAAEMLEKLGFLKYDFCDRATCKQGTELMNGRIFSIAEIENRENLLIIIAIENEKARKEIEQTLRYIKKIEFLSFFVLEQIYSYVTENISTLLSKTEQFSNWYKELGYRANIVKSASKPSVLVYQNGKVGSSTISKSLWNVGIENAHVHRFFFRKDIVGELILGEEESEFIKKSNFFSFQFPQYVKAVKNEIKGKKIITMVREPIAVDLSTVFQWIGSGTANRYFSVNRKLGKTFGQVVSELMVKIQNRLFDWFEEELKELCGIDVLDYPFNIEKGYTIISQNGVEVLLIKTENMSQLEKVIGDFFGSHQFELINDNVGENKEYSYLYKEMKEKIQLPKEYVEHYYKNNSYMNHFYSKAEQEKFLSKWSKYINPVV